MCARMKYLCGVAAALSCTLGAYAQESGVSDEVVPEPASEAVVPETVGVVDLGSRLAALDGTDPMAYFELAEEVAIELRDDPGFALARRLYVLAYETSRDREGVPTLTRSVCLGLSSLEEPQSDRRRWLLALAALQDDESVAGGDLWADTIDARRAVAEALGAYRAQEYLKARTQMGRPHAARYLSKLEGEEKTLFDAIRKEIESEPSCPTCRNARTIRSRSGTDSNRPEELCPTCLGNPGPRLTTSQYMDLLRAEIDLLDIESQTWSAQIDLDGGDPLREADPDQLARLYGVDPNATRFVRKEGAAQRTGMWVRPQLADD